MIGKYYSFSSSMNVDLLGDFDASPNITDCPGGNAWIMHHFGQCVSNNLQWASFILGFVSLAVWFFPSIPQIYENYKRGNCEEALSPTFLFLWFFGDSTNLIGAILTKQLPLQIYVGAYYIIQDCIILGQYVYYKIKNRFIMDESRSIILNSMLIPIGLLSTIFGMGLYFKSPAFSSNPSEMEWIYRSRTILAPIFNGASDEAGYVCGTLSAISYLVGRVPQLIKNYKRRSVEGVSLSMYALICLGNATYGCSVLFGLDGDAWTYYARHLPWLFGSLTCLFLDSLVFVQYYRYKDTISIKGDTIPINIDDSPDQSICDPSV